MVSDMLSQEEIDALLNGDSDNDSDEAVNEEFLNEMEIDALGEIGNISMGTAATTLFTLLGQKVIITTPEVSRVTAKELATLYPKPFIAVDVKYRVGLEGTNLLVLKSEDVKIITDLMMGGDGTNTDREINEMDLSAISEAMNQMVGSSSTSLSEIFNKKIDIDPPRAFETNADGDGNGLEIFNDADILVKISFKMIIGDLIDSEIMQLLPLEFARSQVKNLLENEPEEVLVEQTISEPSAASIQNAQVQPKVQNTEQPISNQSISTNSQQNYVNESMTQPQNSVNRIQQPVNVEKVEFEPFDKNEKIVYNENINMVQEIPVEITVELGRTKRKISEILEYGPGTIVELDKLVGEALEIYANGRIIAKGEVVVIDDNFGIRITDIINAKNKINKL